MVPGLSAVSGVFITCEHVEVLLSVIISFSKFSFQKFSFSILSIIIFNEGESADNYGDLH